MKNLNLKIFLTLQLTGNKYTSNNISSNHLLYSLIATDKLLDLNFQDLAYRLRFLKCEKIFIYLIDPFDTKDETFLINNNTNYLPISHNNPFYFVHKMSAQNFFKPDFFKYIFYHQETRYLNEPIYQNAVFIFNSMPMPFISLFFWYNNFILTPIQRGKRGPLSIVQHRLSQFITALEGMKKTLIYSSFHNYNTFAVRPLFDFVNMIEKRKTLDDLIHIFIALEKYYKLKLNVDPNDKYWNWNLRYNRDSDEDFILDHYEFMEFLDKYFF